MGIFKKSLFFSAGTMISRVFGMVRDILMAKFFGTGIISEAFFVAFRIPNLFRDMFAEGALSQAFTKTYSQLTGDKEKKFLHEFTGNLLLLGLGLSILGFWLAPFLVDLMTTIAVSQENKSQFIFYAKNASRVLFVILPIFMVAAILMGALTKHGKFFVSSLGSVFFNVGYIIGILLFSYLCVSFLDPSFDQKYMPRPLFGLSLGVVLGAFLQLMLYFFNLRKHLKINSLSVGWSKEMSATLSLMLPAAMAASAGPINNVINTNFATALEQGSVSWLSYAFRVFHLPVAIFAVALGTALMPTVSKLVLLDPKKFILQFKRAFAGTIWVMGFFAVCTFLTSDSIITLLFQRGAFSNLDVQMTGAALRGYSFGLIGYGLIKVMTVYFYAKDRTATPLKIAFFCVFINFVTNYFLTKYYGHVAIAMTASIVLSINAMLLMMSICIAESGFLKGFIKNEKWLLLAILSAGSLFFVQKHWMTYNTLEYKAFYAFIHIAIIAIVSTILFGICASIRMQKTPKELWQWLKSQRTKTQVISDKN